MKEKYLDNNNNILDEGDVVTYTDNDNNIVNEDGFIRYNQLNDSWEVINKDIQSGNDLINVGNISLK